MAKELDPLKLSSPRIFLLRMLVFVVLGGLVAFVLYKQIEVAFMANPGLNSLIIGVLVIGIVFALRQVIRLYPEIAWVNNFRLADPGLAVERPPVLLAPMAAILGSRIGRMAISAQMMRGILDSIATRLDEACRPVHHRSFHLRRWRKLNYLRKEPPPRVGPSDAPN